MLKLSFILPCYDVAPYVGRCIESIEYQDIPQTEYEVICVDDCSKDNTVEVIKEYQKQYPNIRLICHTENKTAGGARNTGMVAAKGEYLWFVDPDDAIVSEESSVLYEYAHKNKLDILVFNYGISTKDNDVHEQKQITIDTDILSGQDFFMHYFPKRRMAEVASIWRQLYKRAFCEEKIIRYPEIKAGQDVVFAWESFIKTKRMAAVPNIGYICYGRPTSTTGSIGRFSAKAIMSQSLLFANEIYLLTSSNLSMDSVIRSDMNDAISNALNTDSRNILYTDRRNQNEFYQSLQQNKEKINVLQSYMNRKTKRIFTYKYPYSIWQMQIWLYRIANKIKKRQSISYGLCQVEGK